MRSCGSPRRPGSRRSTCSPAARMLIHEQAQPPRTKGTIAGQPHRRGVPDGSVMTGRALAPLRDRRFRWYFASRAVDMVGDFMGGIALAFAVLEVSDSPSALGAVLAAHSIPLVDLPAARRRAGRPVRPDLDHPAEQHHRRHHPAGDRRPRAQRPRRDLAARRSSPPSTAWRPPPTSRPWPGCSPSSRPRTPSSRRTPSTGCCATSRSSSLPPWAARSSSASAPAGRSRSTA